MAIKVGRADSWQHRDEVDELLLQIKALVFARAILEDRGMDIEAHSREIERLRERLAEVVQRNGLDAASQGAG
jgi:hypothetical protein